MLDIKKIRKDPKLFDQSLKRRGVDPHAEKILEIDSKRRKLLSNIQEIQEKRNGDISILTRNILIIPLQFFLKSNK